MTNYLEYKEAGREYRSNRGTSREDEFEQKYLQCFLKFYRTSQINVGMAVLRDMILAALIWMIVAAVKRVEV